MAEREKKKKETVPSSMTIEQLRSFKGLDALSDEEAKLVIEELERLASITYKAFQVHKQQRNEEKAA